MTAPSGYRHDPAGGPRLRSDVIDVYVFQRSPHAPRPLASAHPVSGMDSDAQGTARSDAYFLQLLRSGPPLADTWHPVMGHVEAGETAVACAWRELREELGLERSDPRLRGLWALEQVHPFFIAELDAIVLSPRFAAEVEPGWSPKLNDEHSEFRWVAARDVNRLFMWPGQHQACREIAEHLLPDGSLMRQQVQLK